MMRRDFLFPAGERQKVLSLQGKQMRREALVKTGERYMEWRGDLHGMEGRPPFHALVGHLLRQHASQFPPLNKGGANMNKRKEN